MLDDTAIFFAVIQQGGFSHAAKYLGFSNGLISRRIALLEKKLGTTLIYRTTRKIYLTPEGEILWQHAQRIQKELDSAVSIIQYSAQNPHGKIRITAAPHFGRMFLTPIIMEFLAEYKDITIDLILTDKQLDPIKDKLDLIIRGAGYLKHQTDLVDSNLKMKLLFKDKIYVLGSPSLFKKMGLPKHPRELIKFNIINYASVDTVFHYDFWRYIYKGKEDCVKVIPNFSVNDIGSALNACTLGFGIGKFPGISTKTLIHQNELVPIFKEYHWGSYHMYAIYTLQKNLPKRTRLLMDFICNYAKVNLIKNE